MPIVEEACTITARGQTTVPKAVRQALGVGYGGRIAFRVDGGVVTVHALPVEANMDPVLEPFLSLLAADMLDHPGELRALEEPFIVRWEALADAVGAIDPDAAIDGDSVL